MKKLLTAVCCALALSAGLAGCAQSVEGRAVVDSSWDGREAPGAQTSAVEPAPGAMAFDPCNIADTSLELFMGVAPARKLEVPGGCSWGGEGATFAAMMTPVMTVDSIASTAGVSNVSQHEAANGRVFQMFAYEGDTCMALAVAEEATLQLTMMENHFDPTCKQLFVAAQMLVAEL